MIVCMSLGSCHSIERDYYEILGVQPNASREEVKKAYHAVSGLMKSDMRGMWLQLLVIFPYFFLT